MKLNNQTKSVIFMVFGGYLLVGNTILSLLFNYPVRSFTPYVSPAEYWSDWWWQYGTITAAIAIIGLFLIIIGIMKRNEITADANQTN